MLSAQAQALKLWLRIPHLTSHLPNSSPPSHLDLDQIIYEGCQHDSKLRWAMSRFFALAHRREERVKHVIDELSQVNKCMRLLHLVACYFHVQDAQQ